MKVSLLSRPSPLPMHLVLIRIDFLIAQDAPCWVSTSLALVNVGCASSTRQWNCFHQAEEWELTGYNFHKES
jgi:hypothetical protein